MVTVVEYDAGVGWSDSYSVDVIVPSLDAVSEVFELGDVCGVRAGLAVDLAPIFQRCNSKKLLFSSFTHDTSTTVPTH